MALFDTFGLRTSDKKSNQMVFNRTALSLVRFPVEHLMEEEVPTHGKRH